MAKNAKKGKGKARVGTKRQESKPEARAEREAPKQQAKPTRQTPDLAALRSPVLAARAKLDAADAEAKQAAERARAAVAAAKEAYREAVAAYREACRKLGVACEFEGGRSANVSPKVSFIVEKAEKGIRVAVKGNPESEELIPLAVLEASVGKAATAYTDKQLGPRERVGNKAGTLGNRLRAVMGGTK